MSYSEEVKQLAYKLDEECWLPHAGRTKACRKAMDSRRSLSLDLAEHYLRNRELMEAIHSREEAVKETPSEQEELKHYYDTVITDMCRGTTVKPWECVRASFPDGSKAKYSVVPDFKGYDPEFYEFALAVHLNRPVWVGSVLYRKKGTENFIWALGEKLVVKGLTKGGYLRLGVPELKHEEVIARSWRDWAVWEEPVKQKVPTRVRVGYSHKHYVTVPDALVKSEHIVRTFFATSKDADEFYEVFMQLTHAKEA